MNVADISQFGEERLANFFGLPPGGVGIDAGDAVSKGAATPQCDAKIMHRIGSEIGAQVRALFYYSVHPIGQSGLDAVRFRHEIYYRLRSSDTPAGILENRFEPFWETVGFL